MTLPPIYSRRKRQASTEGADVYQYDVFTDKLRVQTMQTLWPMLDLLVYDAPKYEVWNTVCSIMCEELGVLGLSSGETRQIEFYKWFNSHRYVNDLLDSVELTINAVAARLTSDTIPALEKLIERLNARFQEAAFGYRMVGLRFIQISSEFAHENMVVPALVLLDEARFASANEEYRKAHDEYRSGEYADCITDCGKSLESVLKVLAAEGGWQGVSNTSTLKPLIDAAFSNGLFPGYMEDQINGLKKLVQGAGTVRNKSGAHGAGTAEEAAADKRLASYQLHQTAAAILFIAGT